jgi:sialidase-1
VEGSVLQDTGLPCAPLLYSGPEDPAARRRLTVRRSHDGGRTWATLAEVTGPAEPAAYSDIVEPSRATLGVLYETGVRGAYERIDFRTVPLGCASPGPRRQPVGQPMPAFLHAWTNSAVQTWAVV